ncbi:MAG: lasso peptide biosynthesis B2 protein [Caulobacteraceae bacterium]|nr:lasso peptide biosynthesis B2 protein [Caulobacteraceae bacterium]
MWLAAQQIRSWKRASREDADAAHQAICHFNEMRPWLPKRYVCLFDALCLIRFSPVARHARDAVIGVRARPFLAHSWVELDGAIVDDGGEDCASMQEIVRL